MLKNHLKFAFRLFIKDRFYSLLNIAGLTLAITTGIILLLVLQYDLGYDKHNTKHERIYRYTNLLKAPGVEFDFSIVAPELAPVFLQEVPEIENVVRFHDTGSVLIRIPSAGSNEKAFNETRALWTDSSIFDVFTLNILEGDPKTALSGTNKAVLTSSTAQKYFGDESAIGKHLILPNNKLYEVTAIIEDLPGNTHIKFDVLLSGIEKRDYIEGYEYSEAFWNSEVSLFILFHEGVNTEAFFNRFPAIYDKTFRMFGERIEGEVEPNLEPLADIHYYSTKADDYPKGDIKYVYAFIVISIFLILLACINYTNMSTARAIKRTSEIAIRKALGFSKTKLFLTILGEALLLSVLSMTLAIILSYIIINLTAFPNLLGRSIEFNILQNGYLLIGIPVLTFLIGLLSGFYPAIYIPSIPTVSALKGNKNISLKGGGIRKLLISSQFVISLFVIICTILMGRQIDFLRKIDLGFNKENVLLLKLPEQLQDSKFIDKFKGRLLSNPEVISFSTSNGAPGISYGKQVYMVENDNGMVQQELNVINCQYDYIETLGLKIIKGRDFTDINGSDYYYSYILNETAVKELGWEQDPLGKKISSFNNRDNPGKVIGVIKDFNYISLHNEIEPLIIRLNKYPGFMVNIRLSGSNIPQSLEKIEEAWKEEAGNFPFEYSFLDQTFDEQYKEDQTQFNLLKLLSYLCIFISLLGLTGLSSFTASQKTKEIGIRKVLGASILNILLLFSKEYVRLITIAFLIAVPIANYIIQEWMNNFQHQTNIPILIFIIPGLVVLLVALFTVGFQSWKAAKANPVNAISHE